MTISGSANFGLKEEIRDYWSKRAETFDRAFGHHIPEGPEFEAWAGAIRDHLGPEPRRVLDLACGTGEITKLLLALGHEVTALDFSEAMLAVARREHAGQERLHFRLGDAENTMEPDGAYGAVVCRHLVWTLTEPDKAFADWHRVLKPGGTLLFFDGDWARFSPFGRAAASAIALIDRLSGADPFYDGAMSERHASIMRQLPFGGGLQSADLVPLLERAGFRDIVIASHRPIAAAQRRNANLRNRLRTFLYRRFVISCRK